MSCLICGQSYDAGSEHICSASDMDAAVAKTSPKVKPKQNWGRLPVEYSTDPIRAYKTGSIVRAARGDTLQFAPMNRGPSYKVDDNAICEKYHHHVPGLDCSCGFYAWISPEKVAENRGEPKFEVDLSGSVIVCDTGYRAEHQTVMRVVYNRRNCAAGCNTLCDRITHNGNSFVGVCSNHSYGNSYTTQELSNMLGTEVCWNFDTELVKHETFRKFALLLVPTISLLVAFIIVRYNPVFQLLGSVLIGVLWNVWVVRRQKKLTRKYGPWVT